MIYIWEYIILIIEIIYWQLYFVYITIGIKVIKINKSSGLEGFHPPTCGGLYVLMCLVYVFKEVPSLRLMILIDILSLRIMILMTIYH